MKMKLKIKEARERANLTQTEVASRIGVAPNTFCGYENGLHDPKSGLLIKISKECNTSIDFLLGMTDDPRSLDDKETKKSPAPEGAEDEEVKVQEVVKGLTRLLMQAGWIAPGADLTDAQLRTIASYVIALNFYFKENSDL